MLKHWQKKMLFFGSKIMYYVVIYDISGVSDAEYESLIPIKYLGDCVKDFYIMVLLTHYQKNRLKISYYMH